MYGLGPASNPELYQPDKKHLLLQTNSLGVLDLPRDAAGVAFVGDPRNDENLIINQMQQAFILLHNHFLDNDARGDFALAQQLTRWHYQWIIVHDYLPHVVGQQLVDDMVFSNGSRIRARTMFYRPGSLLRPMMPIEYSAGAYRWGHSGIRPEYEMHESPGLSPNPAVLPIFNGDTDPIHARDLRGSRPLYPDATIDWNYFFQIPGVDAPDDRNFARLIDTQVGRPLHDLPDSVVTHVQGAILALAERNLLRGKRLGLPAGQDVAARMKTTLRGLPGPLTNAQLDPERHLQPGRSWLERQGPAVVLLPTGGRTRRRPPARPGRRSNRRRGDPRTAANRHPLLLERQDHVHPGRWPQLQDGRSPQACQGPDHRSPHQPTHRLTAAFRPV